MIFHDFEWDNDNENHISKHKILPYEVEEVFYENTIFRRTKEGKRVALGKTLDGRYLFVVFVRKAKGIIRVITSRNMTDKEKSFYKKQRGVD